MLRDQEDICCALGWKHCPNSTLNSAKCSLITRDSLPIIVTSSLLGSGTTAMNLISMLYRMIKSKSHHDVSLLGLELAGFFIGLALLMAGLKDILFDVEYLAPPFGGEHWWYTVTDIIHSMSTVFCFSCCAAHVYIMHISFKQLIAVRSKVKRRAVYLTFSITLILVPLILTKGTHCSHNNGEDTCACMMMTVALFKLGVTCLSSFIIVVFLVQIYKLITG